MHLSEVLQEIRPCVMNRPYVFISYSSDDQELVWRDVLEFQKQGYNVWLDERNLDKTKPSWKDDVIAALESSNCRLVVFYLSRHSISSFACYEEMRTTFSEKAKRMHNGNISFVPVEVEQIDDFVSFADSIYEEIRDNFTIKENERNKSLEAAYGLKWELFDGNNDKVRIHSINTPGRLGDYYEDILTNFPQQTFIGVAPVTGQTAKELYELGQRYENGDGVAKDMTEAVRLYGLATDKQYKDAQFCLGLCYENGDGVEKNISEAVRWYRLAADQGYPAAQRRLKELQE